MKAIPSPGASASRTCDRVQRARALLLLPLLAMASNVGAQEQSAAVLKLHEVDFFYRSSTAIFSCSALQGRVASLLRALGAREDVAVTVNGCDAVVAPEMPEDTWQGPSDRGPSSTDRWGTSSDRWRSSSSSRFGARRAGREQSAHVRVRLMMPVEVTPEVLAELEKDKSRRELVSRVTGNPAATLNEPIVFPAQRQTVTLSRQTIGIEPEDCELLEQMSTGIFKELGIRVVRRGPRCDRDQISHIPPQLTVEALMPVMPRTPQLAPAAGQSDPDPRDPTTSESEPPRKPTETPPE